MPNLLQPDNNNERKSGYSDQAIARLQRIDLLKHSFDVSRVGVSRVRLSPERVSNTLNSGDKYYSLGSQRPAPFSVGLNPEGFSTTLESADQHESVTSGSADAFIASEGSESNPAVPDNTAGLDAGAIRNNIEAIFGKDGKG